MARYQILAKHLTTLDVPQGLQRSVEGALHLDPGEVRDLTDDEAAYAKDMGVPLRSISMRPRRNINTPPKPAKSAPKGKTNPKDSEPVKGEDKPKGKGKGK